MGLDITAYKGLKIIPDVAFDKHGEPTGDIGDFFHSYAAGYHEKDFPGRSEGISKDEYYSYVDSFSFRAGSYSGYSAWRDKLATLIGYSGSAQFWDFVTLHPETTMGQPFAELINFSDCEGIIGPVVSKKLTADFFIYLPQATAIGGWFLDAYLAWQKAFEFGADNGAVSFH